MPGGVLGALYTYILLFNPYCNPKGRYYFLIAETIESGKAGKGSRSDFLFILLEHTSLKS